MKSDKKIDVYASQKQFFDHVLPVWLALPEQSKGNFYVSDFLYDYAKSKCNVSTVQVKQVREPMIPASENAIIVSAYGDLETVIKSEHIYRQTKRFKILMEHGAGFTFGNQNASYAGGTGYRERVGLFLCTNKWVYEANKKTYPNIPAIIVGCPKMDKYVDYKYVPNEKPVIAVAFHWDCRVANETHTAWEYYKSVLPELVKKYKVIGHGHPRWLHQLAPEYEKMGIEVVWDLEEVFERADLLVNDSSSILYEFAALGKPVVVLNSPEYRRNINHGLRFWEYANVGVNCDKAMDLVSSVESALVRTVQQEERRQKAVDEVYPYFGISAKKCVIAIDDVLLDKHPPLQIINHFHKKSIGIVYMGFGGNAVREIEKSIKSLQAININIPITIVGDTRSNNADFIKWEGESPFDTSCARNFQFRAGRVKPKLYDLSPYDYTLYIDGDTQFMSQRFLEGFGYLDDYNVAIAQEFQLISQLYNKALAGWEVNIQERDQTIREIGDQRFLNSGVVFFKKSRETEELFRNWYIQWMRFQQWDEQMAFMRAFAQVPEAHIKRLDIDWNHPHGRNPDRGSPTCIIAHWYGRGMARSSK